MDGSASHDAAPFKTDVPPTYEHFLLKDLDTGMRSVVTDMDWVEQPVVPTGSTPTRQPPQQAVPGMAFPSSEPPMEQPRPRHTRTPIPVTHHQTSKRSRSDELAAAAARRAPLLKPSDHVRTTSHKKRDREFGNVYRWQRVEAHTGAIRTMAFNHSDDHSGKWLATGGTDSLVKIWQIDHELSHARAAHSGARKDGGGGATTSGTTLSSSSHGGGRGGTECAYEYIRQGTAFHTCRGHTSDVTDVAWSKNDFLLSGGADRTIRLWHPKAGRCLRRLVHTDIVTSVAFHPTDEQICIAGQSDGIVAMWHLKERKMLSQANTDDLVTATAITPDGTTALVGTLHGRCKLYALFDEIQAEWQFRHTTQLDVRSRRAKNATGKKICGFCFHGHDKGDKVLVSSNDSRIRLYRLDDKSVVAKYQGCKNGSARLCASFDPSGRYVMCASETRTVLIWESATGRAALRGNSRPEDEDEDPTARKDLGVAHESFVVQDTGNVTAATFAPKRVPPERLFRHAPVSNPRTAGLVIVTAGDDGVLRIFGCC